MQNGANQFLASAEVQSSAADSRHMSQPESSQLCAFISSTAYLTNDNCMLQSRDGGAVTQLSTAPNVMNPIDVANRLNKRVVMPLPTIQAVAGIQLPVPASKTVTPMLPISCSASTFVGLLDVTFWLSLLILCIKHIASSS